MRRGPWYTVAGDIRFKCLDLPSRTPTRPASLQRLRALHETGFPTAHLTGRYAQLLVSRLPRTLEEQETTLPIYEYECMECGMHFDKLQRFDDPQLQVCPNGHKQTHRLLSQPAVIFKGSGFYVTDNARNGRSTSSRKRKGSSTSKASVTHAPDADI